MDVPAPTREKLEKLSEATLRRLAAQTIWLSSRTTTSLSDTAFNELKEYLRIEGDLIDGVLMDLCAEWPVEIEGC